MTVDLAAELAASAQGLRVTHLRALERMGVIRSTLAGFNRDYQFGVGCVVESSPGLFSFDPDAAPHLLLPVWDHGELIDLVAFRSGNPTGWLLRTGLGWALGVESGLERHTWGDVVPLAVSPLEWLQGGCQGLCILDWAAPEVHYLVGVRHLVCSNEHQAAMLRRALAKPVCFPAISVQEAHRAAA